MRQILLIAIVANLALIGCDGRKPNQATGQSPAPSGPTQASSAQDAVNPDASSVQDVEIPDDVEYSILDSDTIPGVKRSLDVRLSKKVSEEVLRAIAMDLKSRDSNEYDRTFIGYYLPEMKPGAGAWATTHFDPDLKVQILGLTAEEEESLAAEPASTSSSREIVGQWIDESPFIGSRISIFKESGKLFMERKFKDGSSLTREIVERQSQAGRRFEEIKKSGSGDHWLLRPDGSLQIRDNDGLIATAKKIGRRG